LKAFEAFFYIHAIVAAESRRTAPDCLRRWL